MVPDHIVDEAPLKIGLYLPGTNLRIDSLASVSDIEGPCLFVIGAWNFADELREKLRGFRKPGEDFTAVYFPRFRVEAL